MKNLKILWASALFLSTSVPALAASTCSFELDTSSVQIDWTAFKTTQMVAVQGSFTEVTLEGDVKVKGALKDFLTQISAEIPLRGVSDLRTGNPARDTTLFTHFFSLFKKTKHIDGSIAKFEGNDNEGTFNLNLKMNEKELGVPMRFTRDKQGHFVAKGGIDVLDFGLKGALDDLHKTCEALHTGPDGVSKTWPTVEIKLIATITQKCNS